jgi:outer membrane protein assembly factor BamB
VPRACPDCGRTWGRDATFCGRCGAALAPEAQRSGRRVLHLTTGRVVVAAVVLLAVAIGVAVVTPRVRLPSIGVPDVEDDTITLPSAPAGTAPAGEPAPTGPVRCTRDGAPVDCVAWDVATPGGTSLGQRFGGARLLVDGRKDALAVREPATGRVRWSRGDLGAQRPFAALADVLLVAAPEDGAVTAVDAADGTTRWEAPDLRPVGAPPSPGAGVVVLGRPGPGGAVDELVGLDAASGEPAWRWSVPWSGGVRTPANPPVGGALLVTGQGRLARLDVATGRVAWVVDTLDDAYLQAEPDGHVGAQQLAEAPPAELWIHDGETGAVVQTLKANGVAAHAVVDGVLVVSRPVEGVVRGRDLGTGDELWSRRTDSPGTLGHHEGGSDPEALVVLERDARRVRRLDPRTGEVTWEVRLPDPRAPRPGQASMFLGTPLLVDDTVVLEGRDSTVTVLDVASGRQRLRVDGGPDVDVRSLAPLTLLRGDHWLGVDVPSR